MADTLTKLDTVDAIVAAVYADGATVESLTAAVAAARGVLDATARRTMVDTVVTWDAVGHAAIAAATLTNGGTVPTKFADIAKALGLAVGSGDFGGWTRSSVSRCYDVTRFVPLTRGSTTLPDAADWEDHATGKDGRPSVTNAAAYLTWQQARRSEPRATTNRRGTGAKVKAVTFTATERQSALDTLTAADAKARPTVSTAKYVPTYGDLRTMSTEDVTALRTACDAELARRELAPDAPAPLPDMTRWTKAQILAYMADGSIPTK